MTMRQGAMRTDGKPGNLQPGDATVCSHCATILVFDAQLNVRRPTDSERLKIQTTPELLQPLAAMSNLVVKVQRATRLN